MIGILFIFVLITLGAMQASFWVIPIFAAAFLLIALQIPTLRTPGVVRLGLICLVVAIAAFAAGWGLGVAFAG